MKKVLEKNLIYKLKTLNEYQTVSSSNDSFYQSEIVKALNYIKDSALKSYPLIIKEIEKNGSPSLILSTTETNEPDIALNAHVDVVPAPKELFGLKIKGDKAYGRGAADMKFAIAIYLELLNKIRINNNSPSLSLIITSDEEVGSANGAKYIAEELGYRPKLMFVPDGGINWRLVQKAKGALHVKIETKGVAVHASQPWKGKSANDQLINFLVKMRKIYPQIKKENWETITMNIGILKGGQAGNQVADQAEVLLDFRFPYADFKNSILDHIKENLLENSTISYPAEAYCFNVDLSNPAVKKFIDIVEKTTKKKVVSYNEYGATDARFFSRLGTTSIVLMPPAGGLHSDKEWISIKGIIDYYYALLNFINSSLKTEFKK
jgi:succinyl-diaminopimelate desuccinylase